MPLMLRLLFIILNCATLMIAAPDASKLFPKQVHDFGVIEEDRGSVRCEFEYENKSDAPIIITNVQASCGCSMPEWSVEPLMPGAKEKIVVTFNPAGRPGVFDKEITVSTSAPEGVCILHIKGTVNARQPTAEPKDSRGIAYKITFPKIAHDFGEIAENEEAKTVEFQYANAGEAEVSLRDIQSTHGALEPVWSPDSVQPATSGSFKLVFNPRGLVGDFSANVLIYVNEFEPCGTLQIRARIIPDKKAPPGGLPIPTDIACEKTEHDFGVISEKSGTVTGEFLLKNQGQAPLFISDINTACGCLAPEWDKSPLAPGGTTKIRVQFNPKDRPGSFLKPIQIHTSSGRFVLTLKGHVGD